MTKDLDEKVEKLEELTDANTVIAIGGYKFTPAKLMIAGAIISSVLGGLYGAFEVYKDYMDMKQKIEEYIAPDLSGFDKRLEVITQKAESAQEYTNQIKNDLKSDIRRLEGTVESVERTVKQSIRETEISIKDVQTELRQTRKELDISIKDTNANLDKKIQRALDNPLAK